jgi:hypothetical protein
MTDKTGTIRTQVIGGIDPQGEVKALAVTQDGQLLGSGSGGSGGGGVTEAEIKSAIESATNLDDLEAQIIAINNKFPTLVNGKIPVDIGSTINLDTSTLATLTNQQEEIEKLTSLDSKATSDPATGSKQDEVIGLLKGWQLLNSYDLTSNSINQTFSIDTIANSCNTFAIAFRGNPITSGQILAFGTLNNNEETYEEVQIYRLGTKTFTGNNISENDIYLCRCNSPFFLLRTSSPFFQIDNNFATLDIYRYPAYLYDGIINHNDLNQSYFNSLLGTSDFDPSFWGTGILGWLAAISNGINNVIDARLNTLFNSLGSQGSIVAGDDISSNSLISLIKRLLSVKLPNLINNAIPVTFTSSSNNVVGTTSKLLRDDFKGSALNSANWTTTVAGSGQTVSVSSSKLNVTTGTVTNAQGIIRSANSFKLPLRIQTNFSLSQKISNQYFTLRIANLSNTESAYLQFDGITNNVSMVTSSGGFASNSTFPAGDVDWEITAEDITFYAKNPSTGLRNSTYLFLNNALLSLDEDYYISIIVSNSGTPASSTTLSLDYILIANSNALNAEITENRALNTTQTISGTVTANLGTIGTAATESTLSAVNTKLPSGLSVISTRLIVDGSSVTQPISGTVTANLGTTAGIASEATTSVISSKIPLSLTVISNRLLVDGTGVTQPISASSLPLPVGAASSSLQSTANSSLGSIDAKTPNLGQQLPANSMPIVIPAVQLTALTPPTTITANLGTIGAAATESTLSAVNTKLPSGLSVISTRLIVDGSSVTQPISGTVTANLGTTAGIASEATTSVISSKIPLSLTVISNRLLVDGTGVTQPISASSLPLPVGAASSSLQSTANSSLGSIDAKTPNLGQQLPANSMPIVIPAVQLTALTPPTTITANLGTIGAAATESTLSAVNTKLPSGLSVISTRLIVDGSSVTQPISAATLPLPTGAATETTLNSLNTKFIASATMSDTLSRTVSATFVGAVNLFDNGTNLVRGRATSASSGVGLGRQAVASGTEPLVLLSLVTTAGIGTAIVLTSAYKTITAHLFYSSGTFSAINCLIEGSFNGTNWFTIMALTDPTNNAKVSSDGVTFNYVRGNVVSITGSATFSILAAAVA